MNAEKFIYFDGFKSIYVINHKVSVFHNLLKKLKIAMSKCIWFKIVVVLGLCRSCTSFYFLVCCKVMTMKIASMINIFVFKIFIDNI